MVADVVLSLIATQQSTASHAQAFMTQRVMMRQMIIRCKQHE